jgi:nucleoid-associated protein YgaU
MGLFSFVKNAGAKLFNKKEDEPKVEVKKEVAPKKTPAQIKEEADKKMAAGLKKVVTDLGFEIEALNIRVNGDEATVSGTAPSNAVREKVILVIGNMEGIGSVDDQMEVEVAEAASKFHTVEKGDTLSKIAKEYYGDAMKYPVIFEANKPMLTAPELIYPGQVLRVPPLEA